MKNFIFWVIFCVLCPTLIFSEKNKSDFKVDFFSETDTKEMSAGTKITTDFLTAVFGARDFDLHKKKFSEEKKSMNVAAQINSVFYAGTLSFSNSISRLKNPVIHVSSPLKNSIWLAPGINCSLPQYNGSPKPISAAIVFQNVEFAATEENEIFASLHTEIPFLGKKSSINFTGGIFRHKKDFKSSWYNESKWYGESGFISCSTEFNVHFKHFETSILAGASENPFGGFFHYFSAQNALTAGPLRLNSAFYQGDEDLITADGTQPKTRRQLELNPQLIIKFKRGILKTGILAHGKFKNQKNEYASKFEITFQTSSFQTGAAASCSYKTEEGFFEYGANFSFIKKTKSASWNTKFSYKNEDIIKNTCILTQSLRLNCSLSPEFSVSCTAREKNGDTQHKISASASIRKKTHSFTANFKIAYDSAFFTSIP